MRIYLFESSYDQTTRSVVTLAHEIRNTILVNVVAARQEVGISVGFGNVPVRLIVKVDGGNPAFVRHVVLIGADTVLKQKAKPRHYGYIGRYVATPLNQVRIDLVNILNRVRGDKYVASGNS
jgi:hypothetical protein